MKRWISLLLASLLVLLNISAAISAESQSTEEKFQALKDKGIFTGFEDGSARLGEEMSREQFAAVLVRLLDLKEDKRNQSYTDVLKSRWSYGHIEAVTAAGLMNGMGGGKFGPTSKVTIEQLAATLVRASGQELSSTRQVNGKVSPWAKPIVPVALDLGYIAEQNDYTVPAIRAQLVEAVYEMYSRMNEPEYKDLKVKSLNVVSNTKLEVNLSEVVQVVKRENFVIRKNNGSALEVLQAILSDDGKKVTLVTEPQDGGYQYTLTVDGNVKQFVAPAADNTKPRVVSVDVKAGYIVELAFSERVDESTAKEKTNYSINNGLTVHSADLSSDGKKVTLLTSAQRDDRRYAITIYNIADQAGNVMEPVTLYFGEKVDTTPPTVRHVVAGANTVTIFFSERLNRETAEAVSNYYVSGNLGYPAKLVYDDSQMSVKLTTLDQTPGKIYEVTINNVKDRAGNEIKSNTKASFVGIGSDQHRIRLQSIRAVDTNTIELAFDKDLTSNDVSKLKVDILRDNNASVSMRGWSAYVHPQTDKKKVRVQYRTNDEANPSLFRGGHIYFASASGISGLDTRDDANVRLFAGTDRNNADPYISNAKAVNSTALQIWFSEPVKNVAKQSFTVKTADGTPIDVVSDSVGDKRKVVTEVTLRLATQLQSGQTYYMTIDRQITDAAGWNGMRAPDGSSPYVIAFAGVGDANAAPRITGAAPIDRYNFEIAFSEPVVNSGSGPYTLWNETDNTSIRLKNGDNATLVESQDRTKLTVKLHADAVSPLQAGKTYTVVYDAAGGRIVDLQGKPFDVAEKANSAGFKGVNKENERPFIKKIEAEGTKIKITFSENIWGYKNENDYFDIVVNGQTVTPAWGSIKDGKAITLTVPKMPKGKFASLRVSAAGADRLKDENRQGPSTDWYNFGTK